MTKFLPLLVFILFVRSLLPAQQVENPGFEFWEDAGTVWDEPVDWSSIKTSDAGEIINGAAPAVWEKSAEHHSGEFSVKLTNLAVLDIVAAGTITNGRVHADFNPDLGYVFTDTLNAIWNTPCSVRPDSLTGWFKYFPQGQDIGTVQALLHVGYGQLPEYIDSSNWVGYTRFDMEPGMTVNSWTRFSVPFHYYDDRTPQYLLFVLTSGNGTTPVANSYAFYDDFALVTSGSGISNPAKESFSVTQSGGKFILKNVPHEYYGNSIAELVDLTGRTLWAETLYANEIPLNAGTIPTGIYVFRIRSKGEAMTAKIFVNP